MGLLCKLELFLSPDKQQLSYMKLIDDATVGPDISLLIALVVSLHFRRHVCLGADVGTGSAPAGSEHIVGVNVGERLQHFVLSHVSVLLVEANCLVEVDYLQLSL